MDLIATNILDPDWPQQKAGETTVRLYLTFCSTTYGMEGHGYGLLSGSCVHCLRLGLLHGVAGGVFAKSYSFHHRHLDGRGWGSYLPLEDATTHQNGARAKSCGCCVIAFCLGLSSPRVYPFAKVSVSACIYSMAFRQILITLLSYSLITSDCFQSEIEYIGTYRLVFPSSLHLLSCLVWRGEVPISHDPLPRL